MINEKEFGLVQRKIGRARARGDLDGALCEIHALLRDENSEVKATGLWYRGVIREDQGALIKAKQDWIEALDCTSERSILAYQLEDAIGRICEKLGAPEEALDWYRRALKGSSGVLTLTSFIRVNGPIISSDDQQLVASVVARFWDVLKSPGKPDLTDLPGSISALSARVEEIAAEAMIAPEISDVIAQRCLIFIDAEGRRNEALVEIGRPLLSDEKINYYHCRYRITGVDYERVSSVHGIDAVQALQLVMNVIGAELNAIKENVSGEIRWEAGENGDLGFPTPEN